MPHMPFPPPKSAGKWVLSDRSSRSVVKTLTWRITGSSATFIISWIISGDWAIAGGIALIQATVNTLLYYLHERAWNLIAWGTK